MKNIKTLVLPVDLPVKIAQGFNGKQTHKLIEFSASINGQEQKFKLDESYSLDFILAEGSNVYAAKNGTVHSANVTHDFNYFPKEGEETNQELLKQAMKEVNAITLLHKDGTFSEYCHLKKDGSLVLPGQKVKAGEQIGFSGNTGLSSGPHLHFCLYEININDTIYNTGFLRRTMPYAFKNYNGPLEDRIINKEFY